MTAVLRPRTRTLLSVFPFVICYSFFVISVSLSAQAAALTGRVVDPDGRSVANAEVFVSGSTAAPLRARTDADGKFELANLEPGRYTIVATAPGLVSDAQSLDLTTTPATLDIALHLSALTETLVVSASQIDQPLSRTPDSVTVIPGREIEAKQQFTLSSALRSVPGLTLQQNGGPGTVTSLFSRGGESDYTLVLVDGIRAEFFRRRPRSLSGAAAGCGAHRSPPRIAERALRLRCDRRRDPDHHAQRRQAVGPGATRSRQPGDAARGRGHHRRSQRRALAGRRELFRGRRLHRHSGERRDGQQ